MEPEFWQARWREGRIGFHQDRPSPLLVAHWDACGVAAGSRVFVPLCGKSLDMAWLAERGHRVLGVELSELAVAQFFQERGLTPQTQVSACGVHYLAGPFELICGDVFALDAQALIDCAGVYDRAALIALPPQLRQRYAAEMYTQLPHGCRGLLISLDYPQHEKQGPPFSVPDAEVDALFGADWRVQRLERRDILDAETGPADQRVTRLHASAFALRRNSRASVADAPGQ